jgi:hypothetical protein
LKVELEKNEKTKKRKEKEEEKIRKNKIKPIIHLFSQSIVGFGSSRKR